jgi:FAD/FMN-containing dehydrogenase
MALRQTSVSSVPVLDDAAARALEASLRGALLRPGDEGYDPARRVWNGMIDKRPALIAQVAGAADIAACVAFAREHALPLAIRAGGHNVAGHALCDDGLVIDLRRMKGLRVDPRTRTARAEAGLVWAEFDRETQAFGLATTGGVISTTGLAGLTLGGGVGWLNGLYGLACDNLLSADVVLADGRLVTASATEHPDLFWALRGGGGNFGVVTSFEYQLYPFGPEVLAGIVFLADTPVRDNLALYRELTASAPDELTLYAATGLGPDGRVGTAFIPCYAGQFARGEHLLQPVRQFGPALIDTLAPKRYVEWQSMLDSRWPYGRRVYWKSHMVSELSDGLLDVVADYATRLPSPVTRITIEHYHGAYGRVGKHDTAYWHRDTSYQVLAAAGWEDPAQEEATIRWVRELHAAMAPFASTATYLNFVMVDEPDRAERVRAGYGDNYQRLAQIKAAYDPTNLFRVNNNIEPAPPAS